MNAFRLAGDMTHLISILVLLLKIYSTKSCSWISLKTQELYALVFLARYLDLFTDFISVCNSVMKVVFILSTVAIVWCMRRHRIVKRSYDKELDTFRHYYLVGACFVFALLVHEKFTFQEVFWAFSIYVEAVAIIPQLVLLQQSGNVDNLTGQYVFFLGAYHALYILNWIYRYLAEVRFSRWIACISGLVQTALYADFFFYYFLSRGTVLELGISPIVTSGMLMQLLAGLRIIKVDNNVRDDHVLLNEAKKLLGLLIAVGQAVAYVLSEMYGPVGQLGVGNAILIIIQLCFASIIVMCLDELVQKGYGLGSGISLSTATNICENILSKVLSPTTINNGRGAQFEGALVALFHLLITRTDKVRALREAFYLQDLPNVTNLLATVLICLIVIYFQGFRVVLPVRSKGNRGPQGSSPIKLFYTSNMPIILQSAFVFNVSFLSQLLYKRFGGNFWVNLLGKWKESAYSSGQLIPVGGLAYYVTPRASLWIVIKNLDSSFSFFRPRSKQLKDQNMVMPGHRESNLEKELDRYIPTAAASGGMCIGALTVLPDFMGARILLAVTIIYQCFQTYEKQRGSELGLFGL